MELADFLLRQAPAPAVVLEKQFEIQRRLFERSPAVLTANFARIHTSDLNSLFDLYDEHLLRGQLRAALGPSQIGFRFAPRMTRTAGTTSRFTDRKTGATAFEIAIASSMLFDGFHDGDHREVTVCGVECATRLEALQRVFEHELVHLLEFLCWRHSKCSQPRFQRIASSWFLHKAHTHAMITRRERAAVSGIRPGARVRFEYEGRELRGVVNRVTKRATVLVEDPNGMRYSDGNRYAKYYIPISWLSLTG
jgi:hypothetical protein